MLFVYRGITPSYGPHSQNLWYEMYLSIFFYESAGVLTHLLGQMPSYNAQKLSRHGSCGPGESTAVLESHWLVLMRSTRLLTWSAKLGNLARSPVSRHAGRQCIWARQRERSWRRKSISHTHTSSKDFVTLR